MGIQSIWSNDFYEKPPQPLWAFEVVWNQYSDLPEYAQTLLHKAAISGKIAERKANVVQTFFGGVTFMHLARSDNADQLTIEFNENEDLDVTQALQALWNRTAMNQDWPEGGKSETTNPIYRYQNGDNKIVIKILKPNDNYEYGLDCADNFVSKIITFYNCKLMQIGETEFNYTSDEVMKLSATFSFDYMKVTNPTQTITNDLAGVMA